MLDHCCINYDHQVFCAAFTNNSDSIEARIQTLAYIT